MIILNRNEAEELVRQAEHVFKLSVKPDIYSQIILLLTFRADKGIEYFAVGPWEWRHPFIFIYGRLITDALKNGYRVIVKKEGSILRNAEWYIEFLKKY